MRFYGTKPGYTDASRDISSVEGWPEVLMLA